MKYRQLGRSGLTVSAVCLGGNSWGAAGRRAWGAFDEEGSKPFFRAALDAWGEAGKRWLGEAPEAGKQDGKPALDKRFAAPEWQANPAYRSLRDAYLIASDWLLRQGEADDGMEPLERTKLQFHLRQFVDAMSPTLLLASNPAALKRAMETGGASVAAISRSLSDVEVRSPRL